MPQINISQIDDEVVLYYGCADTRINAYTLASSLVSLADAARATAASVNPGYDVEVVVEALGAGSFKARIRAIYTSAANLFSKDPIKTITLGIVSAIIYEHAFAPSKEVQIDVRDDIVIIQQGDMRVTVSRQVYDGTREAKKDPEVRKAVSSFFRSLDEDPKIESIGVTRSMEDPPPPVSVPREVFAHAATEPVAPEGSERIVRERAELQILKAILERSRRKWEFSWRGIKISAPVIDPRFYDEFFAHRITIAPGDTLEVEMLVHQLHDPRICVYTNELYEILRVLKHTPRVSQSSLGTEKADA